MIDTKTKLCGLIGNPVEHSLSPIMHNAAFKNLGLNFVYLAFKVDDLEHTLKGMRELNIRGLNVTIPYKVEVMKYLNDIDETARKIGAVNTIVNDNGFLKGFNTDWIGAIKSIEEKTSIKGKKVVMLGAGGAARAVAFGIKNRRGRLTILNRTVEKAEKLSKEVDCNFGELDYLKYLSYDILINTTSIGMYPNKNSSLVEKNILKNVDFVFDIVYNPLKTKLLKDAENVGCQIIEGINMLVLQGAEAFELWTGKKPDIKLMKNCNQTINNR